MIFLLFMCRPFSAGLSVFRFVFDLLLLLHARKKSGRSWLLPDKWHTLHHSHILYEITLWDHLMRSLNIACQRGAENQILTPRLHSLPGRSAFAYTSYILCIWSDYAFPSSFLMVLNCWSLTACSKLLVLNCWLFSHVSYKISQYTYHVNRYYKKFDLVDLVVANEKNEWFSNGSSVSNEQRMQNTVWLCGSATQKWQFCHKHYAKRSWIWAFWG